MKRITENQAYRGPVGAARTPAPHQLRHCLYGTAFNAFTSHQNIGVSWFSIIVIAVRHCFSYERTFVRMKATNPAFVPEMGGATFFRSIPTSSLRRAPTPKIFKTSTPTQGRIKVGMTGAIAPGPPLQGAPRNVTYLFQIKYSFQKLS